MHKTVIFRFIGIVFHLYNNKITLILKTEVALRETSILVSVLKALPALKDFYFGF